MSDRRGHSQSVQSVSVSIRPSLSGAALCYRATAKAFPAVTTLCQCYRLCAYASIVTVLDVTNVSTWSVCVLGIVHTVVMWCLCGPVCMPSLSFVVPNCVGSNTKLAKYFDSSKCNVVFGNFNFDCCFEVHLNIRVQKSETKQTKK